MKHVLFVCCVLLLSMGWTTDAEVNGKPFTITLTGAAEIPGPGDPDGSGTVYLFLNQGQGTITYSFNVQNITLPAVMAHIHVGTSTQSGPPVVTLFGPGSGGPLSGVVTDLDKELVKSIRQNPENYYVNIHTTDYMAGALRGQMD